MFERSPIYVLEGERTSGANRNISTLSIDEPTRISLAEMFSALVERQIVGSEDDPFLKRDYSPGYTIQPDEPEYMCINDFAIPDDIADSMGRAATLPTFRLDPDSLPNIRALFVYEHNDGSPRFAFQRFRTHQFLSPQGFHLFFNGNVLRQRSRTEWSNGRGKAGITISPIVDCYIDDEGLKLKSSFFANQIFDLSEFNLEATDDEIQEFLSSNVLDMEDTEAIKSAMGIRERKKVASIRQKRVLEEHPVQYIKQVADQIEFALEITSDGNIYFPTDNKKRRELLAFLDEDIYRGSFSDEVYLSNSKTTRSRE